MKLDGIPHGLRFVKKDGKMILQQYVAIEWERFSNMDYAKEFGWIDVPVVEE